MSLRTIISGIALLLLTFSGSLKADAITGVDLLLACADDQRQERCFGYIQGVMEGLFIGYASTLDRYTHPPKCIALSPRLPGFEITKIRDETFFNEIIKDILSSKERYEYPASYLVSIALAKAYPCDKNIGIDWNSSSGTILKMTDEHIELLRRFK